MTRDLLLSNGEVARVSEEDYERVVLYRWNKHSKGYATGRVNGEEILLHRFIMDALPGQIVDHRDGDKLNCVRKNLRFATQTQNTRNSRKHRDGSSRFKGVSWDKAREKWTSGICVDGKRKCLGRFESEEEAARVYDSWARLLHGEYARTNFDD